MTLEEQWAGGRGGRPLAAEDMLDNLASSPLAENKDSEEVHWPGAVPLSDSAPLVATLGLLLKLNLLMVELLWIPSGYLKKSRSNW